MKLTSAIFATGLLASSVFAAPAPVEDSVSFLANFSPSEQANQTEQAIAERATASSTTTTDDGETGIRAFIGYSGSWTHLKNQGKLFYDGTESYTHDASG
jgi:hypothetical protein